MNEQLLILEANVAHYENVEDVSWHFRFDVAAQADPTFASPLFSAISDPNQTVGGIVGSLTGWRYRLDEMGAAGDLVAMPEAGMPTHLSLVRDAVNRLVGRVFYVPTSGQLALLSSGTPYLLRTSQYNGAAWGDDYVVTFTTAVDVAQIITDAATATLSTGVFRK